MKQGVLGLNLDGEIPEHCVALTHGKKFNMGDQLSIFRKICCTEFYHEFREGEVEEMFTINWNPILDMAIVDAHEDLMDLLIGSNVLMLKVAAFKGVHDGRSDIRYQW